jgi:hypothetical protein
MKDILKELESFGRVLGKTHDYDSLSVPYSSGRSKRNCQDVANYFVDQLVREGMVAEKYVFIDIQSIERDGQGRVCNGELSDFNVPGWPYPWQMHCVAVSRGEALEPILGSPLPIKLLSYELFGRFVPVYALGRRKDYGRLDVIQSLDARGVFE